MNPRLKNLFQRFPKIGIDALLVSSWPNVTYLSGFKNTESWIIVAPKKRYFITDSRYSEQAKREARDFELILRDKKGLAEIVSDLCKKHGFRRLGFEAAIVTHAFYLQLQRCLPANALIPAYDLVESLRLTKDSSEIALIKKSADIAVKGYHYIRRTVGPGETERQIQGRLEYYTKGLGSEKPAFDIIVAAGARASMPHCQTGDVRVKDNESVLLDMGVVYGGYHSDLTRPIFLGKMSALQKKIHRIVWEAQRLGIKKAGPGVPASEVDAACRRFIEKRGYGKYFGHGTGHGVGLEIHEAPGVSARSQTVLRPGMVITVEPGIYLPGKIGIRIEDMVLVTEKGNEVLTSGLEDGSL